MDLVLDGKISLISFIIGSLSAIATSVFSHTLDTSLFILLIVYAIATNISIFLVYRRKNDYDVAVRGLNLGLLFGAGLLLSYYGNTWIHFGWYLTVLACFHWSEYFFTALTNPRHLALDSYLIDHSREYYFAATASLLEFAFEWYFIPDLKQLRWVSVLGLLTVIGGEFFRKAAMFTAKSNFNHYVQHVKEEGHQLVTSGVYSITRHPAYVGWFYWSIGTQVILCNPVCLVGYAVASWKFFSVRIFDEEISLLNFFGEEYADYQERVGTGLPFIYGYRTRH